MKTEFSNCRDHINQWCKDKLGKTVFKSEDTQATAQATVRNGWLASEKSSARVLKIVSEVYAGQQTAYGDYIGPKKEFESK